MNLFELAIILVSAFCLLQAEQVSYEGYQLLNAFPENESHLKLLNNLDESENIEILNDIRLVNQKVDILLTPKRAQYYKRIFELVKLPFIVIEENFQRIIDLEKESMRGTSKNNNILGRYARYNEIRNFIDEMVSNYPNIASTYSAGKSYQGRDLQVIVLKTQSSSKGAWIGYTFMNRVKFYLILLKQDYIQDCGIHAREWLSPASCVWFIEKIAREYKNRDRTAVRLLNTFEIHILPIVNPDGYEYTHTTERLWRKNRRRNTLSTCYGTDLNRNFGYAWMTGGSSDKPCSDSYAGPSADSEPETKALQSALQAKPSSFWATYVSLHTYGNLWMPPYGNTMTLPSDYDDLADLAQFGVDAIRKVNGTIFKIITPARMFGVSSGGSPDWAKGTFGIKYSYALELRPGQTDSDSHYGFVLPEDKAPVGAEETYQGLKAYLNALIDAKY